MCGRFFIDPDDMTDEELIALLDREKAERENITESRLTAGEVRPGDMTAVIALNRRLQRSAFVMQWGYRLNNRLLINARSETAADKPIFRDGMASRRCLIPASAYFEWDHREKPFQKYRFHTQERKTFYLAGLYRFEPESPLPVFTILTREATPQLAQFHDRMPVIIPLHLKDIWLNHQQDAAAVMRQSETCINWQKE